MFKELFKGVYKKGSGLYTALWEVGLVSLLFLPLLIVLLLGVTQGRKIAIDRTKEFSRYIVNFSIAEEKRFLEESKTFLEGWDLYLNGDFSDPCSYVHLPIIKVDPQYKYYSANNAEGDIVCSTNPPSGKVSVKDRDYFQAAFNNKEFSVGSYQVGRITGAQSINTSYPVIDKSGSVVGVLALAQNIDLLNAWVKSLELPEGSEFFITDRNGEILASSTSEGGRVGEYVLDPKLISIILAQKNGEIEFTQKDGVARIYAFGPLSFYPNRDPDLFFLVGLPLKEVLEPSSRLISLTIALFMFSLIFDIAVFNKIVNKSISRGKP